VNSYIALFSIAFKD
jgi:hypothetical protein